MIIGVIALALLLEDTDSPPPRPMANSSPELSNLLKGFLADNLPDTLIAREINWGKQRQAPSLRFDGLRPTVRRSLKNDGMWQKIRFTTHNKDKTLHFAIGNWQHIDAETMRFNAAFAFDARVHYDQQNWESGVRLLSTSARARMRVHLRLLCEVVTRSEASKDALLPDVVIRMRVIQSNLDYDDVVFEHLAGMGGTGARWMGELVHGAIQKFRPSLEENLKARANAAIVRAADTREVRLGFGSLFKK